jgi:hypothetical protein
MIRGVLLQIEPGIPIPLEDRVRASNGMVLAVVVGLGFLIGSVVEAEARTAVIEVAAPLQAHTEDGLKAALLEAVQSAAKGALAMGLGWVEVSHAAVVGNSVAVQVMATDTPQNSGESVDPDQTPAPDDRTPGPAETPPHTPGESLAQADL